MSKSTCLILKLFGTNVPWRTLFQDVEISLIHWQTWPPGERACFPYMVLSKKFKTSSCPKELAWFENYLVQMFLVWPSTKFVKYILICWNTWYLLFMYRLKTLRNFLSKGISPIWKCSLSDPLPPRLFKLCRYIE